MTHVPVPYMYCQYKIVLVLPVFIIKVMTSLRLTSSQYIFHKKHITDSFIINTIVVTPTKSYIQFLCLYYPYHELKSTIKTFRFI